MSWKSAMNDHTIDPDDDQVTLYVHLPRRVFNGLLTLGDRYGTGVHGVIRHLAFNAVDSAARKHKQND
jgi:hypothetical protein